MIRIIECRVLNRLYYSFNANSKIVKEVTDAAKVNVLNLNMFTNFT